MENMTTEQLRQIYRDTRNATDSGQALDLIAVTIELGRRGWTLNADESEWIPPLKPVKHKTRAQPVDAPELGRILLEAQRRIPPVHRQVFPKEGAGVWKMFRDKLDEVRFGYVTVAELDQHFTADSVAIFTEKLNQTDLTKQAVLVIPTHAMENGDMIVFELLHTLDLADDGS